MNRVALLFALTVLLWGLACSSSSNSQLEDINSRMDSTLEDLPLDDIAALDDTADSFLEDGSQELILVDTVDVNQSDTMDADSSLEVSADTTEVIEDPNAYDFTVVALPDTQMYAQSHPEVFLAQIQWIVDHAESDKILFVTHLGDIVDSGDSAEQWVNARAAMDLLDEAGIPYGTAMGNHDRNQTEGDLGKGAHSTCQAPPPATCCGRFYIENFGPQRYTDRPWYGGASPSALSNYEFFTFEGQEFLFLHLTIDPWVEELEWADDVLAAHPDAAVSLSTHRYLFDFRMTADMPDPIPLLKAGRFDELVVTLVQPLYMSDGIIPEDLFQDWISQRPQIYMVQCGHIDAEFYQVSENVSSLPVHELLVDFQSLPDTGGDGWLRLLRYNVGAGRIRVETYSPTLERFRENREGCDFSVELLVEYFADFNDLIKTMPDYDVIEAQFVAWTSTPEGEEEFCDLIYDQGWRDSDFTFDVAFSAYRPQP